MPINASIMNKTIKSFYINSIYLIVNIESFNCFIHYTGIYYHENCQIKVFTYIFNDTVTL